MRRAADRSRRCGRRRGIASTFIPRSAGDVRIELMMPEVSVATFLPVAIATGTATFVGRWFFGDTPPFTCPRFKPW